MTPTQYVTVLAWTSTFGAFWYSFVFDKWTAASITLIIFSLIVALLSGIFALGESRVK